MLDHPYLPKSYSYKLQDVVARVLEPYRIRADDPTAKDPWPWDTEKAWNDALKLLKGSIWYHEEEQGVPVTYRLRLPGDKEKSDIKSITHYVSAKRNFETIIAGIAAKQIMSPDSGIAIQALHELEKGDIDLVLSRHSAHNLRKLCPFVRCEDIPPGKEPSAAKQRWCR